MINWSQLGGIRPTYFPFSLRRAAARICLIAVMLIAPGKRLLAGAESLSCAGDCTAGGAVTISDIIVLVNIALGNADPSLCAAGIPPGRMVDITLIIEAVGNALGECTPLSIPTPTATKVPTTTPTTGSSSAGTWTETQLVLTTSNCNSATVDVVKQDAAAQPASCDYQVSELEGNVQTVDCEGNSVDGTVDSNGMVLLVEPAHSETFDNGCMLTLSGSVAIDTSRSPTTAAYTAQFMFSGPCSPFGSCTAHLQSQWTRHTPPARPD